LVTGGLAAQENGASNPPPAEIQTAADVLLENPEFRPGGGELDPNSPAAVLGAAFDMAERFLRLKRENIFQSPALTERSRDLLPTAPERQKLEHILELREANWYHQFVDARFAGDRLATMLMVFTPRDPQQSKTVYALDMVRKNDEWQVTLDQAADAQLAIGEKGPTHVAALRTAVDARLAEIKGVISAPLANALDFHGTWTTHFAQTFVYLTFQSNGEVFFLQTREGSSSYGVHDYHLTEDEVIIEMQYFPIRLKRRAGDNYWEQDGQRHYPMLIEDPRCWFPDCNEPLQLKPVYKGEWPIRRPVDRDEIESPAAVE
jgi:hypothetical protein